MDAAAPGRRYGGVPADERRRERRQRLLDAGLELLGTRGYAQTTVSDVLGHAGLTSRYFYEHFENREALLAAVYDQAVLRGYGALAEALQRHDDDPLSVSLPAQLEALYAVVVDDPRMARVIFVEAVGVSSAMEAHRRTVMRRVAATMAERIEARAARGEIPERDFQTITIGMLGAMHELVVDHLHPGGISRDEALGESTRLALATLQ
ncbi:MAG: TetR/AcrR family transcriptional regulator [Solirubrobacteraceae bacterium]|nr:TetR/AcrR family transcriptional regulator [Solirubrobacteraceae bacterium]